jgi:hypothetical protein
MQCAGMYSRAAWGGNVDPYILVSSWKASEYVSDDAVVSLIIYEYKDVDLIGISVPDEPKVVGHLPYRCSVLTYNADIYLRPR